MHDHFFGRICMNGILLVRNDVSMLLLMKAWSSNKFSMKDLGETNYALGIRIYRVDHGGCLDNPNPCT